MLNGRLNKYVRLYQDGIIMGGYRYYGDDDSEKGMLYGHKGADNWNNGLDTEMTKDMHLIHAFHHLYGHTDFSIFDLLWVRDFNIEIHIVTDYYS